MIRRLSAGWTDRSLRTKSLVVVGIPVVAAMVACLAFLAYQDAEHAASDRVAHSIEVQGAITGLMGGLVNAETGVRGYLITGQPGSLAPYTAALTATPSLLDRLTTLVADDPMEEGRAIALGPEIQHEFAVLADLRAAGPTDGPATAATQALMADGKVSMDGIRSDLAVMANEESSLLVDRTAAADTVRTAGLALVAISFIVALGGGVLATLLLTTGIVRRVSLLRANAERVATGEPVLPIAPSNDELGRLAKALDRSAVVMADRDASLRAALDELERFFELAVDVFVVTGPDGHFLRVNRALSDLLGVEPSVVLSRPWNSFVHPDDRERSAEEFAREVALGHRTVNFANRYVDATGGIHWMEWNAEFDPSNGVVYGIARDVTVRRDADDALRAAQAEAERANRAKTEFLSRMSHELRTPLNSILGFSELLLLDDLTAEQLENVGYVARAGHHLLDLINEVLDISRIESGQMTISPEPIAVGDLIDEVTALVGPLGSAHGIVLDATDAVCAAHVLADRQRLKQVLLNLLANAVKYNREGGTVTVSCATVAGERLRIAVRDTGYGIPPERLDRLFAPFDRLGAELGSIEGTGMGLALSKGLVEAMGGRIEVESTVDVGSTFSIELRLVEGPLEVYDRNGPPDHASRPGVASDVRRILYVEDNLSNVRLVERILTRRPGVELITAMQASLGIELAREHRPEVILLDLHLPDAPGRDVLARLKGHPDTRGIPVIILSADATKTQATRLLDEGAFGYLTKPIEVGRFIELVDAALAISEQGA
ncbi:MAG: ATP-binding protein [Candidatus Limnocylindrales bacterium]